MGKIKMNMAAGNHRNKSLKASESGLALIVSLMILIVLTLLGLSAARTTVLEEKMAGNLRDENLAFQSAESALRDAEAFIESVASVNAFNDTGGLYSQATPDPDYFSTASWGATNSLAYSGSIPGVASQPRYIIKYVGVISSGGAALNIGGYGNQQASVLHAFRITARGTGGRDSTRAILQEFYARRM